MAQPVIQPSFAAGELSPSLYGRVDLAKFHVGAALLRNFFVDYRGGISNRAGTKFVGQCIDSTTPNRLIKFQFSTIQSYALCFGNLTMKVIIDGAFVESSPGVDYVLATPYTGDELALLKFTQSADVMTLCHPNHPPANLTRTGHAAWTLTPISFVSTVTPPTSVVATPSMTGDGTGYSYQVTAIGANGLTESLPSAFSAFTTAANSKTMSTTLGAHVLVTWALVPGAVLYNIYRSPEVPGSIAVSGQGYGYVGSATDGGFIDNNIAPDFTRSPPQAANPFASNVNPTCTAYFQERQFFAAPLSAPETFYASKSGDFANMGYSSPSRSDDSITGTIASQQVNAIKHLVPMNSLIAFSSGGAWRIDSGAQGGPVTPSAIEAAPQAFSGCSDVPPLTINYDILYVQEKGSIVRDLAYNFYVNVYTGADMTTLSNHLFYGHTIREWAWAEEPFKIVWAVRDDGILLSFTYLKEQDVYGWAHHDTDGLFKSVCTMSEGTEDAVYVIVARQIGGVLVQYVERIQSRNMGAVPELNVPADMTKAWFVDCGLALPQTYPNATATPNAIAADPSIYGCTVVTGGAGYSAPVINVIDSTGTGAIVLPIVAGGVITGVTVAAPGINYSNPQFQVQDATGSGAVLTPIVARVVTVNVTNVVSATFTPGMLVYLNYGYGRILSVAAGPPIVLTLDLIQPFVNTFPADSGAWRANPNVTLVTGLDHLVGETVSILADGNVLPQQVVEIGGGIVLPVEAGAVVVGLPYLAQGQSLYLDLPGEPSTVQGKRKTIPALTVRVQDTRGLKVGRSFDKLQSFKERRFQAMGNPVLPVTGDQRILIGNDWDTPGQLCWQQSDPLPATLLALIPEVVVGDTA